MDSTREHITGLIKQRIRSRNCMPPDISVDRSFKAVLWRLWESWMTEGEHSFKAGQVRHASFGEVARWVTGAWTSVSVKAIVAGFKKAGLIMPMVGDDADQADTSESSESEEEHVT